MTRALGPRVGLPPEAALPFTVLAMAWLPVLGVATIWLGGHTASLLTGHGSDGPAFGWRFAGTLLHHGVQGAWPNVARPMVWSCTAAFLLLIGLPALWAVALDLRRAAPDDPLPSLASAQEVSFLAAPASIERAQRLRPSSGGFASHEVEDKEVGIPLGVLRTPRGTGRPLRASWEDVVLAAMAPRAGKTTASAIPAVLDAPAAVVATSNKSDLWSGVAAEGRTPGPRRPGGPLKVAGAILSGARLCTCLAE
jgi:hypothetical protein